MVSSAFAGQAQYQADMLNCADVRVSFARHPISDASREELVAKAEETFEFAVDAIKSEKPIAIPDWANKEILPTEACKS